ncbi:MAG: hypothetical protein AB4911_23900, partial [Oscillochloridaceae bacterium umkhey_bin13]
MSHRRSRSLSLVLLGLMLVSLVFGPGASPRSAQAQIRNAQPTGAVASIVDCIRAGDDLGRPSEFSPRFAVACLGGAWDRDSYDYDTPTPNGDAPRTFPAVKTFGDGKPDAPGEPGHITIGSLGNSGTEVGDIGLGAVFGLAYTSGTNPAAPAAMRRGQVFAAAYHKRITRFGDGGPGAIYRLDTLTNSETLYAQIPNVVPGPTGAPGNPGDGSRTTWPNGLAYSPTMGGVHSYAHDAVGLPVFIPCVAGRCFEG